MVFLKFHTVCTRTVIKTVDPRVADKLNQVLITISILCQHNEVIATEVFLCLTQTLVTTTGHIHLTTEDGLERFKTLFRTFFIHANTNVVKFFDTEHVAVIRYRHASHAVLNSLIHKPLNTRLSIEN